MKSISFVMPMYNEEENIRNTLDSLRAIAPDLAGDYEIVVVDDASTDNSAGIVEKISEEDEKIKIYKLRENTRFGGAFAECFKKASKEIIVYLDSDLPVDLEDIKISFNLMDNADVVTGYSKIYKGDNIKRKVISGVYNFLVQLLFGLGIKDINSGYKIVRSSLVEDLSFKSKSPFVDVELFLHAKKKGAVVRQFPLMFHARPAGKSYISRIPVILATFRDMLKVRFTKSSPRKRGSIL